MSFRMVSFSALAVSQLVFATGAFAQDAGASSGKAEVTSIDEIIVTAERREQSLQKLATTASVVTGAGLERQQVTSIDGLVRATPSLSINDGGLGKFVNVRGVGKSVDQPGVQAGVAYYVDGVPVPNQIFLTTPFYDLSRVELLRGPQGTLVGMNSTGGALLIVTQNPRYGVVEGALEQSASTYNDYRTRATLNLPLGTNFALRVAGELEDRDSFYTNDGPAGGNPGRQRRRDVRAALAGKLSDDLEVFLRGEYYHNDEDGVPNKPIPGDPDPLYNVINSFSPSAPFHLSRDFSTAKETEYYRLSAEIRMDIGHAFQLRSVTGYQNGDIFYTFDPDGTSLPTLLDTIKIREPVITQEINLISNPGGAIDWVLGGFYLKQKTNGSVNNVFTPSNALAIDIVAKTRTENKGLFGQFTYHATDAFNVTAGLRYNQERHYYAPDARATFGSGFVLPLIADSTDKAVTGRLTLDYQVNPENFLYATVSRGFKGGGNNTDGSSFKPEYIWNYELGLKSSLLDRHVHTQLGLFMYRNQGLQLEVYAPTTGQTAVTNVTDGRTAGAEFQADGKFGGFGFNLAAAYTHGRFDKAQLVDPRYGSTTPIQIEGRDYLFLPGFTFNAGVEYGFGLGGGYTLTPRVQYSHVGSQWASVFQVRPTDFIPARDIVDATLRLTPQGKGWSAELYGSNLFDETYVVAKAVATAGIPGRIQYYGAPRQVGVRVGFTF